MRQSSSIILFIQARNELRVQSPQGELVSGFINGDDGSVVVVGVQEGGPGAHRYCSAGLQRRTVQVYQTTRRLDCQKTATVPVGNGSGEIHLEKDSIFTLVFKGKEKGS